jgi:imidazolonepropionase-like amidohydrolase
MIHLTRSVLRNMKTSSAILSLLFVAAAPLANAGDGKLVIEAGKIVTLTGEVIENGKIVIEEGRITAVGVDVDAPWDAEHIDASGLVAYPGFVEAIITGGVDRPNENVPVAPFLDISDSIDPVNVTFENFLRSGVTTINVQQGADCVIGARGHVVKPVGRTVEEMSIRPRAGIVLSASPRRGNSRATQAQALRTTFGGLRRYLNETVAAAKAGDDYAKREAMYQGREPDEESAKGRDLECSAWTVEGMKLVPRWEIDEKQAPLVALVEGKIPAFIYCGNAMDVGVAIEVAESNGFLHKTVLVVSGDCDRAVDWIAERGVPVIIQGSLTRMELDEETEEEEEIFLPKVYADAGVRFALRSVNSTTQSLAYQAARCVAHGMSREDAFRAISITPAEIIGVAKRVGSLSVGMDGNVVLYGGDPFSVEGVVQHVIIEGVAVYDRATDSRMRHLEEGVAPDNTQPADPEADPADEAGDGEDGEEG